MLKKILFASTIVATIAITLTTGPLASADYYDCSGNLRPGEPGPSECHYFIQPAQRKPNRQRKPNILNPTKRKPNVLNPNEREPNVLNPNERNPNTVTPTRRNPERTSQDKVNVLTPQARETVNVLKPNPREPVNVSRPQARETLNTSSKNNLNVLEPARQRTEKTYKIRNTRKYCVKNYCYFIYDYCDSSGNCIRKQKKYENPNYNPYEYETAENSNANPGNNQDEQKNAYNNNILNNLVNNYINNHYYQYRSNNYCNSYMKDCVYRGFHFGGYHNGYWRY